MTKPSTPAVWASGKSFGFQPSPAQQAQGFDYIATVRPGTGAPITDDHDWPLNSITTSLKWLMDQLPDGGVQALITAMLPKRSFSGNDFIRIPDVPGGLIIQWGGVSGSSQATVTYPTQFPVGVLAVVASSDGGLSSPVGERAFVEVGAASSSSLKLSSVRVVSGAQEYYPRAMRWVAIGW